MPGGHDDIDRFLAALDRHVTTCAGRIGLVQIVVLGTAALFVIVEVIRWL
jgi:hypothetical protein